ncbi:MAG: hypothetical protein ACOCSE_06540, partial [Chitinivibrionales bacterium]
MLPRRWIILLILPIIILFGTLTCLNLYIEDKGRINSLLESIVVPFTGGDIEVGKVSIGFFSLRFSELEMNFPFNYFSLSADDIKISFSPLGLIQHRDDIVKSVESVILVKPLITIEESDFEQDNKIELDRIK